METAAPLDYLIVKIVFSKARNERLQSEAQRNVSKARNERLQSEAKRNAPALAIEEEILLK